MTKGQKFITITCISFIATVALIAAVVSVVKPVFLFGKPMYEWTTFKASDGTTVKYYMVQKQSMCFAVVTTQSGDSSSFQLPCSGVMLDAAPVK